MAKHTANITLAEIDDLKIKFNQHEYYCEKHRSEVISRINRLEMILYISSGSTILFLAGILFTAMI
jgi:hypothetical protein